MLIGLTPGLSMILQSDLDVSYRDSRTSSWITSIGVSCAEFFFTSPAPTSESLKELLLLPVIESVKVDLAYILISVS